MLCYNSLNSWHDNDSVITKFIAEILEDVDNTTTKSNRSRNVQSDDQTGCSQMIRQTTNIQVSHVYLVEETKVNTEMITCCKHQSPFTDQLPVLTLTYCSHVEHPLFMLNKRLLVTFQVCSLSFWLV